MLIPQSARFILIRKSVQEVRKWYGEFSSSRKELPEDERNGFTVSLGGGYRDGKTRSDVQNIHELVDQISRTTYGTVQRALTKIIGYYTFWMDVSAIVIRPQGKTP